MVMVLREAGIDESNWRVISSALGLSLGYVEGMFLEQKFMVRMSSFKGVFEKWQDQEGGNVSWDKLAEAIQNVKKYGVDYSQTILEISGEGGVVVVNCIISGT